MSYLCVSNSSELHRRCTTTNAEIGTEYIKPVPTSDEEMEPLPSQPSAAKLLDEKVQSSFYPRYFDRLFSGIESRWRNWIICSIFGCVMISTFVRIISMGPFAVSLLVFLIQIKCFHEIISIGYVVYKSDNLPWFRTLSWYFLFASNYWFYGKNFIRHFGLLMHRNNFLLPFVIYHRMIAFLLYTGGFVAFVISLKKTYYPKQFTLFGYTHIALMIFVVPFHATIQNIYQGMIWFLFPVSLIICNDIMAYVFGFFFGRTPLTKLSPKKTWEGFIGGGILTLIFGFILAGSLCQYLFFICPLKYDEQSNRSCRVLPLFQKTTYHMPQTLHLYPFQLHSLVLSLFASSIGPFGGFFASGFKRAFRIKDFAEPIPGHGGFVDRFDCQLLMTLFTNVYISTFIRTSSPYKLFQQVVLLPLEDRIEFLRLLRQHVQEY